MLLSLDIIMRIRGENSGSVLCKFSQGNKTHAYHSDGPIADQSNGYLKVQLGESTIFIGFTTKSMGKELQEKG